MAATRKSAARKRGPEERWSRTVSETSDALDLKPDVFTLHDPKAIAQSLKSSAEHSDRRKAGDVDADSLHQPRGPQPRGGPAPGPREGEGRAARVVRKAGRPDAMTIDDLASLEALFGEPGEASLKKEVTFVHPHYAALIAASPFAVLATSGPGGLDASPRGDPAGFVVVEDPRTLLMPERRGNNRIDSLRNIVGDPRVALLFLIPGHGETLRVNGRARISIARDLLARFAMNGKPPQCVLVIAVETIYFQCARAIQRSGLWTANAPGDLPSAGRILAALTDDTFDGETYDRELPARQKATLY